MLSDSISFPWMVFLLNVSFTTASPEILREIIFWAQGFQERLNNMRFTAKNGKSGCCSRHLSNGSAPHHVSAYLAFCSSADITGGCTRKLEVCDKKVWFGVHPWRSLRVRRKMKAISKWKCHWGARAVLEWAFVGCFLAASCNGLRKIGPNEMRTGWAGLRSASRIVVQDILVADATASDDWDCQDVVLSTSTNVWTSWSGYLLNIWGDFCFYGLDISFKTGHVLVHLFKGWKLSMSNVSR